MTIAANFHSMLISACRRAGIFNADGMWSDSESVTPDDRALAAQKYELSNKTTSYGSHD